MPAIARDFFKLNAAILFAAIVTFLLFYFMQYLIQPDSKRPEIMDVIKLIDSTMPEFEPEVITNEMKPEPITVEELPKVTLPTRTSSVPTGPIVSYAPEQTVIETPKESVGMFATNVMIPLIRTTANYPSRALQRGIEGYVELSFTVDGFGNVIDPLVLNAVPEGVFERSALQSISKWKYSPAVKDGQPIATYDVRQRIVFQMNPDPQ